MWSGLRLGKDDRGLTVGTEPLAGWYAEHSRWFANLET